MPTPVSNLQPTLTLTEYVDISGIFPPRDGGGPGPYLGQIDISAAQPSLFGAPAQGQIYSISQNTALFSILGTTYGGNGTTNFQLPNLAGIAAIGTGSGPGLDNFSLGQTTGTDTNTLTAANLPASFGGSSTPVGNYQPSLAINYVINVDGVFPSSSLGPNSIGVVSAFLGNFAPGDEMFCQGQLLAISDYTVLYDLIGTTYGGDGQTTFALPDLRGRDIVGSGTGPLGSLSLGDQVGTANDVLTPSNLPSSGTPINNVQPGLVLNYYIATSGIFPSQPVNGAADTTVPYLGQIFAAAETLNSPNGAMLCDGRLLQISQNQALFSLLGTTYGGNGTTNFAIPDLRGRSILGAGASNIEGQVGGAATTTLTIANFTPPSLGALAHTTVDARAGGPGVAVLASAPTGLLATQTNGLLATVKVTIASSLAGDLLGIGANFALSTTATKITTIDGGDFLVTFTGATSTLAIANDTNVQNSIAQFETLLGKVAFKTNAPSSGQRNISWTANDGIQDSPPVVTSLAIDLTLHGTSDSDTLNGGPGNDILDGGAGADTMAGGAGNDTYYVDNTGDQVIEAPGGGTDTVYASVDWTLGAGQEVETLRVNSSAGVTLTGNEFNNTLYGGTGADTMVGGAGNDGMVGSVGADHYDGGTGIDVVNYSLASGVNVFLDGSGTNGKAALGDTFVNVENILGGIGADFIVGDSGANRLVGNNGNDILWGRAGDDQLEGGNGNDRLVGQQGNDVLVGGAGADTFAFTLAPAAGGLDRTNDFVAGLDKIEIDASMFGGGLVAGGAAPLVTGASPSSAGFASGVFLYNTLNGFLSWDADGQGAGAAVAFFRIQNLPTLTAADFSVVA